MNRITEAAPEPLTDEQFTEILEQERGKLHETLSADDPLADDEPYWSDSDTAREQHQSQHNMRNYR